MALYQIDVYHAVEVAYHQKHLAHVPVQPQDRLSWRKGTEEPQKPRFTATIEANGEQSAELKFLKEHPEYDQYHGTFTLAITKIV
jgi:hypothetical protein